MRPPLKLTTKQLILAEDVSQYGHLVSPAAMGKRLHGKRFVRYPHVDYLSARLRKSLLKGNARIVISMPPRHGKSWLTSLFTPVWYLSLFPRHNIILASYESEFAASWGRRVRNEIEANKWLGIELSSDSSAADRWELKGTAGGMMTAGIGGAITGRGGHLLIVDDPVKNLEQAMSESYRRKAIEWYQSTFRTRGEPGASIIVIQTRWHEGDLAGYLLSEDSQEKFENISLPAIAEAEGDALGRKIGDPLCAERYPLHALDLIRKGVGSTVWNALYQQRPSSMEGNFFKRQWWRYYRQLPQRFDLMLQSWDLSFKESKEGSFVVGQVWGRVGADKYLIDQVRARADFPTTIRMIRSLSAKWPRAHTKLVEDKANGPAVIDTLKRELSGMIPILPDGSKEARAASVSPDVEAGNVFIPDPSIAPWIHDYVEELANFPKATDNDQVDATTMALKRMQSGTIPFSPISVQSSYGQ
jgi:predicted phage terminase large subunit-like protein